MYLCDPAPSGIFSYPQRMFDSDRTLRLQRGEIDDTNVHRMTSPHVLNGMPEVREWGCMNMIDALLRDTHGKLAAVVSNVAETPLGPGIEGTKVDGITTYDGRVLCALDGRCYLFVDRAFLEGLRETRDHLVRVGVLSVEDRPHLVPVDEMSSKMHLPALYDMLMADGDNEVKNDVPWDQIGGLNAFYWSEAADKVLNAMQDRKSIHARENMNSEIRYSNRGKRVMDLNNKITMAEAARKEGVRVPVFDYGYSKEEILDAYDRVVSLLGGPEKVMLKYAQAVSGLGCIAISNRDELREQLDAVSPEYLAANGALIEEFVDVRFSPGVVFHVDNNGRPEILSVSDQITEGMVHLGNVFPTSTLKPGAVHLQREMYEGVRFYAEEAARRGVTNIVMGLDFLVAPDKEGILRAYASDWNGRYTGSGHMAPALSRILATESPFASPIGCVTDNNLKVPVGTSLDELEGVFVSCGLDLPSFRKEKQRPYAAVTLNYAPAYYARTPEESKAQVLLVQRFDARVPLEDRKHSMLVMRDELHEIVSRSL